MKIHLLISCLFLLPYVEIVAQKTLNLGNMEYVNSIQGTFPTRNIENTDDGIIVTYLFDKVNLYPDFDYAGSQMTHIDGFGDNMSEEEPLFPVRRDTYGNFSGRYESIIMVDSSYIDIPMELSPARKPTVESKEPFIAEQVKPIKSYDGFFPSKTVNFCNLGIVKNRQTLDLIITPILYDYKNKITRIFKKISFKIKTSGDMDYSNSSVFGIDAYLNNFTENQKVVSYTRTGGAESLNNDYLIITTPCFFPACSLFAEWKRTLGYNTIIESRDAWSVDSIKSTVEAYYNPDHFQYLLFVGDETLIPPSGYKHYINNGVHFYFPYDLDYLIFGNTNHSLDIIMGRLPVSNLDEARVVFNKIKDYELNPVSGASFYNNILLSTYFQDDNNNPGYASQNYVESTEEVRAYLVAKSKSTNRVYFTESNVNPLYYRYGHPIPDELRKPDFSWTGDSTDIKEIIDDGAFLAIHRDHGWETRWQAPKFGTDDINNLANGSKLPIIFSIACQTGEYDYSVEDSFTETFLKHGNGGCVGILAASGVTYTTDNNWLMKALVDVIWPNPGIMDNNSYMGRTSVYKLGEILYNGLARAKPFSYQNWNETLYHCFGDPSMRIYTTEPSEFETITLTRNSGNIFVNTGSNEADIAFYDKTDGCVYLYRGSNVTQACDTNNTVVCISAPNKITYVDNPYATEYIQNQTLSGNRTYTSRKVLCGTYVDLSNPFGNVVFGGGTIGLVNSSMEITGQTTIYPGTIITTTNGN